MNDADARAAWRGAELFERPDFLRTLAPGATAELAAAVAATADGPLEALDAATFALPRLGPLLATVQHSLEHGSGVAVLRGLEVEAYSPSELARAFVGLARHVGTSVSQSAAGETLLHVRDEGFAPGDPRFRGPHSNRQLAFHTDRCDVIAFLCVRPAVEGGENDVLSSVTLYRDLVAAEPAVAAELCGTFPYLRHTVDGGNDAPFTRVPVFTETAGRFAGSLLRVLIDRADRSPDAPSLTVAQRAALDALERRAEDPGRYARFRLEAGDVLFLNNWVTFHRRTAFVDDPDPRRRRHLMRLWLAVPNSRLIDPRFAEHFGATAAGALRGGMRKG